MLREDMQSMGPVRLTEVEEAQQAMVQSAKDLADRGEIVIGGSGGDDELIF
jgi:flagellar motor switch protein FliG